MSSTFLITPEPTTETVLNTIKIKILMKTIDYSIIIPIYNEKENISILDNEIKNVMKMLGTYEIIYINDGSKDGSLDELKKLKNISKNNLITFLYQNNQQPFQIHPY
jgi:cellulose synthase/poly-beta-1,6-N-acetylglucosamine synthase-like glycosyltransferase